ncbi:MAG: TetR/AcrR family transcriptional regulator [Alphaproteobacteria bacterium]|nr:MAG: TetR/AcrR family transcriptional regulator [Alphaproteobacteria bacterium]
MSTAAEHRHAVAPAPADTPRGAATRAALLRAARAEFVAHGYGAAATERIVAQARVTRGALYHHFSDKADVLRAVVIDIAGEIAAAITARAARAGNPWQALEQACLAFLESALKNDVRQIYLLDGPAVLGWQAWRDIDFAAPGGLLRRAVHACLEASPNGAASLSGSAFATLLGGAMHAAAFAIAANPAHMVQRAGYERALLELLRSLKFRAEHGGV